MGTITIINHVTLDGVMQAPGRPGEDDRDGFPHGGWAQAGTDEVMGRAMGERMASPAPLLLGRWTYESFFAFWPAQRDSPFTEVLGRIPKYVVSRAHEGPLPWQNSTLLRGEAEDTVAGLKETTDLTVMGSGRLCGSLLRARLVDELVLMVHPLVLGTGRRLFEDGATLDRFRLVDSVATTTGVIIATYQA